MSAEAVMAYPPCFCGHRQDQHRGHPPERCYRCDLCRGYRPIPTDRKGEPLRMVDTPYWLNSQDRPEWFADLEKALAGARPRIVSWQGGNKPHPMDVALVVAKWLSDRGVEP